VPRLDSECELDRLAEIYLANPGLLGGITLEQFLTAPDRYILSAVFGLPAPLPPGDEYFPLLPAQRQVAARVAAADSFMVTAEQMEAVLMAHVECRHAGDHYMEPLRHHTYEINRARMRRVL
jgi:hypothetical protein